MGIKKKISIGILFLVFAIMLLFAGEKFTMPLSGNLPLSAQNNTKTTYKAADTVFVAPPTGKQEVDRINIQKAFDSVKPGGVVKFGPGTYLLGAGARLSVPDVTVLGHPEGTNLRGCDPEAFDVEESEVASVVFGCTGIYIQAERQTIRGLTFENVWHALVVGPYPTSQEEAAGFWSSEKEPEIYPVGGQLIEKNTFRSAANGLRMLGTGKELSIVRNNDFIDVFHAIGMYGGPTHFLGNRVRVENPESVPFSRHPGSAILVSPGHTDCSGHVVAENIIQGYPDPIYVNADRGQICQDVKIVDNIIHASRVKIPEAWVFKPTAEDSTMVGTPITLMNYKESMPGMPEADTVGVLKNILVRGNKIMGAEGLGILVQDVTQSIIADNSISGIKKRNPFPGIPWDGIEPEWEEANGSGIWLSPGSNGNEITGNIFEDIASAAVFLEGDNNRVEVLLETDSVQDVGTGNLVTGATKSKH